MLKPNDITSVKFEKSAAFGYKMEDVDAFLGQVRDSFEQLYSDNTELVKKLEILAEKLEEYRSQEESIGNALLGAQKLGDSVVKEAKNKAEVILRDADIKAEKIVDNANNAIVEQKIEIERLGQQVSDFKAKLLEMYQDHIALINQLPGKEEPVAEEISSEVREEQNENDAPVEDAGAPVEKAVQFE